jgi:hypothetical protein
LRSKVSFVELQFVLKYPQAVSLEPPSEVLIEAKRGSTVIQYLTTGFDQVRDHLLGE